MYNIIILHNSSEGHDILGHQRKIALIYCFNQIVPEY